MTQGENIKLLRESKYMSMLDMEEITGLSKSTIRDIERDTTNNLTIDRVNALNKIAHALHMKVEELTLAKNKNEITIAQL